MLRRNPMKVSDLTCLYCGSRLELKFQDIAIGDNTGACPMCCEPYCININKSEMEEFMEAEEGSASF